MAVREKLIALRETVKGATSPSAELDEAVHACLRPDDPWYQNVLRGRELVAAGDRDTIIEHDNSSLRAETWALSAKVPSYSEKVDDALALVMRLLPDWGGRLQFQLTFAHPVCVLHAPPEHPDGPIDDFRSWSTHSEGGGATMPLAILSALLAALISREPASD